MTSDCQHFSLLFSPHPFIAPRASLTLASQSRKIRLPLADTTTTSRIFFFVQQDGGKWRDKSNKSVIIQHQFSYCLGQETISYGFLHLFWHGLIAYFPPRHIDPRSDLCQKWKKWNVAVVWCYQMAAASCLLSNKEVENGGAIAKWKCKTICACTVDMV